MAPVNSIFVFFSSAFFLLFQVISVPEKLSFITAVFVFFSHLTATINLTLCWRSVMWKVTLWTPKLVCFTAPASQLQMLSSTLPLREDLRASRRVRLKPCRALPPFNHDRHSCTVNLRSTSLPLPQLLYLWLLLSQRNSQSSESRTSLNPRQ